MAFSVATMYDFPLEKRETILKRDNDETCRYYTEEGRRTCLKDWALRRYLNMTCQKGKPNNGKRFINDISGRRGILLLALVCAIPQASLVIEDTPMDVCLSKEEMSCASSAYLKIYQVQDRSYETGCPSPCVLPSTKAKIREDITKVRGNNTYIYIMYSTTMVLVSEEYRLFDFGAIVAAVGGSLGLFLGCSCWQCVKATARACDEFPRDRRRVVAA